MTDLLLQVNLNPDDVIVCEIHIDQGMKAQNPMLNVRFYQTSDPEGGDEPFTMPQEQVTSMLGSVYQGKGVKGGLLGSGLRGWAAGLWQVTPYLGCQVCCMAAWGVPLAVHAACPLVLAKHVHAQPPGDGGICVKSPVCLCLLC